LFVTYGTKYENMKPVHVAGIFLRPLSPNIFNFCLCCLLLKGGTQTEGFENSVGEDIWIKKGGRQHGENCIMMNFIARILHQILLGGLNQGG